MPTKKKKYPAFLLYPQDFLADPNVAGMDNSMLGAYFRLLCYCWIDGFLPDDMAALKKLARPKNSREWEMIRKDVLILFKKSQKVPGRNALVHGRLEKERRKLKHNSKIRKDAAMKRWDANALQMQCLSSSSSISSSSSNRTNKGIQKKAEKEAFRIHALIDEKLEAYGAAKVHGHTGLYHKICQYLPEPLIIAALARVNDKVMEARAGEPLPKDLHRYFIGAVRGMCDDEGINSPIKWNRGKRGRKED